MNILLHKYSCRVLGIVSVSLFLLSIVLKFVADHSLETHTNDKSLNVQVEQGKPKYAIKPK